MILRATMVLLALGALAPLVAQKLPDPAQTPALKSAVLLELKGRYSEAFHQYLQVLLSKDFGDDPSASDSELRKHLLGKLSNVAFELGWLEESWDLTTQLSVLGPTAKETAQALRARLLQTPAVSPLPWVKKGGYAVFVTPPSMIVGPYARLQLGAFRDWKHARTQLDILLEKGWIPFVEDRKAGKERLVAVFVISRRASDDQKRLRTQGFEPSVLPVTPR